jgi:hypothetical protein
MSWSDRFMRFLGIRFDWKAPGLKIVFTELANDLQLNCLDRFFGKIG